MDVQSSQKSEFKINVDAHSNSAKKSEINGKSEKFFIYFIIDITGKFLSAIRVTHSPWMNLFKLFVKNSETRGFIEKEYKLRNSLLTDLFDKNPHVQTLYHISISAFICWVLNALGNDYYKHGRLDLGTNLIGHTFGKIHISLCFWLLYTMGAILFYYLYRSWAAVRMNRLPPKVFYLKTWDTIAALTCFCYYIFSFVVAKWICSTFQLPIGSAAIVCLEQIRYLMKIHSFLRYNCGMVLRYESHSDQELEFPELSKYLYFLFAPTLLYRNEYPRTDKIRWKFAISRLVEFILVIFSMSFTFEKVVYPSIKDLGNVKLKWEEIVLSILGNGGPGTMLCVFCFYLTLHVIQNFFAELLRFGDRLFYADWWTSTGFLSFFRSWNIVVGDWLYAYIYKDMHEFVFPSQSLAKITVFIISAVVHEWALYSILGFFFPVLFLEMMFSGCLALFPAPRSNVLNVMLWYGFMLGNGINFSLYGLEYNMRLKLPMEAQGAYLRILSLGE